MQFKLGQFFGPNVIGKFIIIPRLLHDQMTVSILCNGSAMKAFAIQTGIKQGCVIAPVLFSIFFAVIKMLISNQLPHSISIEYRMDGTGWERFNFPCFCAKTKVTSVLTVELRYANDCAVIA